MQDNNFAVTCLVFAVTRLASAVTCLVFAVTCLVFELRWYVVMLYFSENATQKLQQLQQHKIATHNTALFCENVR